MKKLIVAGAAAAIACGAFAADMYEYKASLKYVDFKTMTINKVKNVEVKVVKTTTLKGWLVTPGCCYNAAYQRNGFLVVKSAVKNSKKIPSIFPADLLAKSWNTSTTSTTREAEGYLFAGVDQYITQGQIGMQAGAWYVSTTTPVGKYGFGDADTAGTWKLFGIYNIQSAAGTWVESWLDASGFGKATTSSTTKSKHCGFGGGTTKTFCLQSLQGSVIGGLFTCQENGEGYVDDNGRNYDVWEWWLCPTGGNGGQAGVAGQPSWIGTTDVLTGTWSIKSNSKLITDANCQRPAEARADNTVNPPRTEWTYPDAEVLGLVKAAAADLYKKFSSLEDFDMGMTTLYNDEDYVEGFTDLTLNNDNIKFTAKWMGNNN